MVLTNAYSCVPSMVPHTYLSPENVHIQFLCDHLLSLLKLLETPDLVFYMLALLSQNIRYRN